MLLSFWPLYKGDENYFIFEPLGEVFWEKLSQIRAVILPPFAPEFLYFFFKKAQIPVFPNLEPKFQFPGKLGAILLFHSLGLPTPKTILIPRLCGIEENPYRKFFLPSFPFVVKGNSGDEGSEVFLVKNEQDWKRVLNLLKAWELEGRFGFLLQEYLPSPFDARVIVIGKKRVIFFRKGGLRKNLVRGGEVIPPPSKELKAKALTLVKRLVEKTGLNHVAVDILFRETEPLLSELNYTFGRRLLGETTYQKMVHQAIEDFLAGLYKNG